MTKRSIKVRLEDGLDARPVKVGDYISDICDTIASTGAFPCNAGRCSGNRGVACMGCEGSTRNRTVNDQASCIYAFALLQD